MKTLLKLIAGLLIVGAPAAQALTLTLVPSQSVSLGDHIVVQGIASGLEGDVALGGYDLDVRWDLNVLGLTSFSMGSGLDVNGLGSFSVIDTSTSGLFNAFEVSLDSPEDLASLQGDSFVLFTLNFLALGEGTSAVSFNVNSLADGLGGALSVDQLNSATVTVSVPAVPLPAAAWLLLSGAGLAFGASRRFSVARATRS